MSRPIIPQRAIIVDGTHWLAHFVGIAIFPQRTIGVKVTAKHGPLTTVVDGYVAGGPFSVVSAGVSSLTDGAFDVAYEAGATVFVVGTDDG